MAAVRWKRPPVKLLQMMAIILIVLVLVINQLWIRYESKDLPVVETAAVMTKELELVLSAGGSVVAEREQLIAARQTCTIREVTKTPGSQVARGEVLVLLDNKRLLSDLAQAESLLAVQEYEYRQAVAMKAKLAQKVEAARKAYQQMITLYDQGQASREELDAAEQGLRIAETQVAALDLVALDSQITKQRQKVQEARDALKETVITSPIEGRVMEIGVKSGQKVAAGALLLKIVESGTLEVQCTLSAGDASQVKDGQTVEVTCASLGEKMISGQVAGRSPAEDPSPGQTQDQQWVMLNIALEEKPPEFLPGLEVQVRIPLDQKRTALLIPKTAIFERDAQNYVFVYQDGMAVQREVRTGAENGIYQEITAGLLPEELVITTLVEMLEDSARVKPAD